ARRRDRHQGHARRRAGGCARGDRRHRPLRQPSHPCGGRADREPDPHRPVPHGTPARPSSRARATASRWMCAWRSTTSTTSATVA
ncbi:hypothetical protein D9C01_13665, partial [Corynebacterium diphtheriae]